MIVRTMTDNEIIRELSEINKILLSRIPGYLLKYRKQLKNRAYKHNEVLGVSEYNINGNRVLVCFSKIVFNDKLADLGISNIVITENGAYLPTNEPLSAKINGFIFLTQHAIDRMWERKGLTLKDFFVNEYNVKSETSHHLVKYEEYGYDKDTYVLNYGGCFFIAHVSDKKIALKTCLNVENLYSNQLKLYVEAKRGGEYFANRNHEKGTNFLKKMGVKKVEDIFNRVA